MDQVSIHKGSDMRNAEEKLGVPVIYNIVGRPDLSGIACLWGVCE